jgi:hypothetical protein
MSRVVPPSGWAAPPPGEEDQFWETDCDEEQMGDGRGRPVVDAGLMTDMRP